MVIKCLIAKKNSNMTRLLEVPEELIPTPSCLANPPNHMYNTRFNRHASHFMHFFLTLFRPGFKNPYSGPGGGNGVEKKPWGAA